MRTALLLSTLALAAACARPAAPARDYLAVWTASADSTQPDFLAVLDVTEGGERYGDVVTTLPVPGLRNGPHHTEHEMPADAQLFANGFGGGRSWIFDLRDPTKPHIAASFTGFEGYEHPHSFLRLPNGNVLATYQMKHGEGPMRTGGLVELTPRGEMVRSSSADRPELPADLRVYSAGIVEPLDRIVTTTTDMDSEADGRYLQVWRLSDLSLLHSFPLADGARGGEGLATAEPRVLADGKTVLVSTFMCGLYLMEGLETDAPSAKLVSSFPTKPDTYCAIPVIVGNHYLVTVPAYNAVVSLDISDPANPREVSRYAFADTNVVPHWIAVSPDGRRVALTGYGSMRNTVYLLRFDPETGEISLDERFRDAGTEAPGVQLRDRAWPHGGNGAGVPHGAVFSRR